MRPCVVWLLAAAVAAHASGSNLIDRLAIMPEHTTFVHLLQRTRLVPTLNELQEKTNLTIFAPSNAAFEAEPELAALANGTDISSSDNQLVFSGEVSSPDNVGTAARQRLLYHVLGYSLPSLPFISMHETLHKPARHQFNSPDGEDRGQLLGGHGQVVRISRRRNIFLREEIRVGVDARGRGGALVRATQHTSTGTLYSVNRVLQVPPPLEELLLSTGVASLFSKLPSEALTALVSTPHLTAFLPHENGLSALSSVELAYLRGPSEEAQEDRLKLLAWHLSATGVGGGLVGYSNRLRSYMGELTTILGGMVKITSYGSQLGIGDSRVLAEDILMQNGVLHITDRLHLPFGDAALSIAKQLIGLNATSFVRHMRCAGLAHYIDNDPHGDDGAPLTIIVPPNELLDMLDGSPDLLRETLLYHIIPGIHEPRSIRNGELIETALVPPKLAAPQRVSTWIYESPIYRRIAFGHAFVLREPIRTSNALIYMVDDLLKPPSSPVSTIGQFGSLSTIHAAILSTGISDVLDNWHGSLLVPDDHAIAQLGVTARYLALPSAASQADLLSVVYLHTLPLMYADDVGPKWMSLRTPSGVIQVRRPPLDHMFVRTNDTVANVVRGDVLTDAGAVHIVDRVLLPEGLDISMEKLLAGAEASIMASLAEEAGFGWLFDEKEHKPRYVLLAPSDASFSRVDVTALRRNPDSLHELVALHIIHLHPSSEETPLELSDGYTYQTLLGGAYGSLALRKVSDDKYMIGIRGARGIVHEHHYATITDIGWLYGKRRAAVGILAVDNVLFPYMPRWYHGYRWVLAAAAATAAVIPIGACCILLLRQRSYKRLRQTFEGEEE